MDEEIFHIADLIVRQMRGELSGSEKKTLDEWLLKPENRELFEKLSNKDHLNSSLAQMYQVDSKAWKKKAYDLLFPGVLPMGERKIRNWTQYMIAASVLLVLMAGLLWATGIFGNNEQREQTAPVVQQVKQDDIQGGTDKATLKLADGTIIQLNHGDSSFLREKNGTTIRNANGTLVYDAKAADNKVVYNLITTDRGGKYFVALADGSKVWLNAASSLNYPTSFPGRERRVELTGEAYFEIAKNAAKPFIVKAGETEVKVTGTEFNINCYKEEPQIKTTLVNGRIKLRVHNHSQTLQPGQQAQTTNNTLQVVKNADVAHAIAWRNGLISLGGADIKAVFRQISRWYDVDVEFQGAIKDLQLLGDIPTTMSLANAIKALELNSGLHCEIVGRKVIVKP